MHSETDIIRRFFCRDAGRRADVAIGIGDDAAAVRVPAGMMLISAIDTIVEGVHFPGQFDAGDIGYRVLAVNLSDMAAIGAQPAWALLSLSIPGADDDWLASFSDGFFELADAHDVALIGGDMVKGPLSATVAIMGYCPEGMAITRGGAQPGDLVYVTGSPGSAATGLQGLTRSHEHNRRYENCFRRPEPRVRQGISLRGIASAMIDISDGLLKDAGHIAASSHVEISLHADAVERIAGGGLQMALTGGDDYELCFSVPADKVDALASVTAQWPCEVNCVGQVRPGCGVVMPGHDLGQYSGYDHFASESSRP